jgi:hypothetical protein
MGLGIYSFRIALMIDMLGRLEFWLAVTLATLLKFAASPKLTLMIGITSVIASILTPLVFADAVMEWRGLDPEVWRIPIVALTALTGEHLSRLLLQSLRMTTALEIWKIWRGK